MMSEKKVALIFRAIKKRRRAIPNKTCGTSIGKIK